MVIPWIGVPLSTVLKRAEPTSKATFVEFTTLMRPGEIFHDLLVFAMFRDDFLELGMLLGDLLKARGITHDFRRRELLRHLLVARIELVQLFGQCKNGHGNLSFRFEALD